MGSICRVVFAEIRDRYQLESLENTRWLAEAIPVSGIKFDDLVSIRWCNTLSHSGIIFASNSQGSHIANSLSLSFSFGG